MQFLGLGEALRQVAINADLDTPKPSFTFRKGDQQGESVDFHRMVLYGPMTIHRVDMLKILTDALPSNFAAHFNKRLHNCAPSENGGVQLVFSDGTSADADVIVGADGINSATRASMYRNLSEIADRNGEVGESMMNFINPTWTGTYAYRTLISATALSKVAPGHRAATSPIIYFGKGKHILSFPISQGRLLNVIGFVTVLGGEGTILEGPSVADVSTQEMVDHYTDWEPEIQQLMSSVVKTSRWAMYHVHHLPKYTFKRTALLGDSAHGMTTHLGAGAAQAIEDAYILGRLLAHDSTTLKTMDEVLQIYEDIRLPVANELVERSREAGLLYEFDLLPPSVEEAGVELMSEEGLKLIAVALDDAWSWQAKGLPQDDWLKAEELLLERLSMRKTVVQ